MLRRTPDTPAGHTDRHHTHHNSTIYFAMTILRVMAHHRTFRRGRDQQRDNTTPDHERFSHFWTGLATNRLTHGCRDAETTAHMLMSPCTPATAHILHDHPTLSPAAADTGRQHPANTAFNAPRLATKRGGGAISLCDTIRT